jgi:plasmid stabilization system protein ParE
MSLPIVFRRVARREFDESADYYQRARRGLGARFTNAVQRVFDRISAQPDFYPVVHEDMREALVSGFPYCIYYRDELDHVLVLAVFHTSRDPAIWQKRI